MYNCIKISRSAIYKHAKRIPHDVRRIEIFPYKAEHKHFGILRKNVSAGISSKLRLKAQVGAEFSLQIPSFNVCECTEQRALNKGLHAIINYIQPTAAGRYSKTLNERTLDLQNKLVSNFNKPIYKVGGFRVFLYSFLPDKLVLIY